VLCHTNERPFFCKVCDKSYKRWYDLTIHMRTHTGEQSFRCDVCRKTFKYSRSLGAHMRRHAHTVEPHFSCKLCDKKFVRPRQLKRHMRVHTCAFSCEVCQRTFACLQSLRRHLFNHVGARAFDFHVYDKTLTSSSTSKVCTHFHMGESASCNVCGWGLTSPSLGAASDFYGRVLKN